MMNGELTDRTAIDTGASRGIGLAIAAAPPDAGANVVLTSRSQERNTARTGIPAPQIVDALVRGAQLVTLEEAP
jgi:NAD(P)-dependent dehydrogenase (short-subunit alcohol dehydrogenase family)